MRSEERGERSQIHVVGIGLDGVDGLSNATQDLLKQATLLVGSPRHLSYFPDHPAERIVLGDLTTAIAQIRDRLSPSPTAHRPSPIFIILTSGDPLFFGLGRLLLNEFPADQLTFHPHLSSVQLAFSRVKLSWQDARVVSVHGRSLEELIQALQQGVEKIAVLTDNTHTPGAIVRLLKSLDLPSHYRLWVCENLGGVNERVIEVTEFAQLEACTFDPLNVVVLQRLESSLLHGEDVPVLGISDGAFLSFSDRPGLMTKREIRTLVLGELALQPGQTVWDIGAGTGSVSIEIARLSPSSTIYAIEKTAAGFSLIQQNCKRFGVKTVQPIHGMAPMALTKLPPPDRVFIGGSGGNLSQILDSCASHLPSGGRIVLALATIEHLNLTLTWLTAQSSNQAVSPVRWKHHLLQINLSRSVAIAALTRLSPLNPVTLVILDKLG